MKITFTPVFKSFLILCVFFAGTALYAKENKTGGGKSAVVNRFPLTDGVFKEPLYENYRDSVPFKFKHNGFAPGMWSEFLGAYSANEKSFMKGEDELESLFKMAFAYDALKRVLDYTIETKTGAAPQLTIDHDIIKKTLKEKVGDVKDKKGDCVRFAETALYYKKPKKLKSAGWITANFMWRKFNKCVEGEE